MFYLDLKPLIFYWYNIALNYEAKIYLYNQKIRIF